MLRLVQRPRLLRDTRTRVAVSAVLCFAFACSSESGLFGPAGGAAATGATGATTGTSGDVSVGNTTTSNGVTVGAGGASNGSNGAGPGPGPGPASSGASMVSGSGGMSSGPSGSTAMASSSSSGGSVDPCAKDPADKMCTACVKAACCTQLKSCAADANCSCVSKCYGKDPQCTQKCGGWGGVWSGLHTCAQMHCSLQCLFGSG